MSDNQIDVKISADPSQLEAGATSAATTVDETTAQMSAAVERMAAETAGSTEEAESAFRRMAEAVGESVTEINEKLEGFSKAAATVQKSFALLAEVAMLGFVGEKVFDLGKEFAEFGEQTEIAAHKTGLSSAAVQELGFAANMTGISSAGMDQAMVRLSRSMANAQQGSKQAEEAFKSVGLSVESLKDMSLDQVLAKVADAFSGTEDGATKSAISMQLFGRAGTDLIPLLDKGSSGIDELRQKAQELGIVMGADDIEAGAKLNESLKEMNAQMNAVKLRAGSELAPALEKIVEAMGEVDGKGGVLDDMFIGLGAAMKGIVAAGIMTATAFEVIAETVVTAGLAVEQAATGNFSTAAATIEIGMHNIEKSAEDAQAAMDKLFDSEQKATSIDMGETGGGADGWEEKGQLKLGSTKKGGSGPGEVEVWKQQLQEQEEASGNFFKSNLAEEDAFWSSKLSQVKAGSKEYLQVYHELFAVKKQEAQQDLADSVAATKTEYDAAKQGSLDRVNLANDIAQKIGQAYGMESKEYAAALNVERKAAQEWAKDQMKQMDEQILQVQKAALGEIAVREQAEKSKAKLGQESAEQEAAALMALENEKYAIEMKGFEDQLSLYADDQQAYQKTLDAKLAATQKHALQVEKLQEQAATATQQKWMNMMNPISAAFSQSVNGMIAGTTTWQSAVSRMGDSVLAKIVDTAVQGAEKWIAQEMVKTAATMAGTAERTLATASGAAAGTAAEASAGQTSVMDSAYRAAAAVYADVSEIPYVGWVLAPGAAAAAFVAVEAFGSGITSAAGGYLQVPNDMMANIHKDEMVLPAWAANGMRNMLGSGTNGAGAAASQGGGGPPIELHIHGQMIDPSGFAGLVQQQAPAIFDAVKQQMRNFQR